MKKTFTFVLLSMLCILGYAQAPPQHTYNFSQVCSSGQMLYYRIVNYSNNFVEITYPGTSTSNPWNGYTKPAGNIILPSTVSYNGVTYTVKAIGVYAFMGCSDMTGSLIIPNSVTTIDNYAFSGCSGFTGNLTIPNSVATIGNSAFSGCSGFTGSLILRDNVATIGNSAFSGCSGFTGSLILRDNVTSIGNYAFYGCNGFTGSLSLGNNVTSIGNYAFRGCANFSFIIVRPMTPPTLGSSVFYGVPNAIFVYVPCGSLGNYQAASQWNAFPNMLDMCDPLTYSINEDGVSVTVTGHVDGTAATGQLVIPETKTINGVTYAVTAIGDNAFYGCSGFTGNLTIPNSVTTIGTSAFVSCSGFTGSLTIPNSVTTIGDGAFGSCIGFTGSLGIPSSVTSIGFGTFIFCVGFTNLVIPASVTLIDDYAFFNCTGLTSITVLHETPPTLGDVVFYNVPMDIPVYVPCGSLEEYQAATGWSDFTNMQCIPETLTVYDGTYVSQYVPANIFHFDDFTRSQFVIPAADLLEMTGSPIVNMTFYTIPTDIPCTTESDADVYLKEVFYTNISDYEPKETATTVYSGRFNIVRTDSGGEMTIHFSTPYYYQGGNLLVGIENTQDNGRKSIFFFGRSVNGSSISDFDPNSLENVQPGQRNFIPKTTFGFRPSCEAKSLPYTYDFEEEDEFGCWTMLNCTETHTGISSSAKREGNYGFQFYYNSNPPQYLISPKLECPMGVDVSFYYKNISDDWPETFQVGYSTTTKLPNAFTWRSEVTANDQNTWMLYEDFFPEGTKYVAVKLNSYDQYCLFLDDFSFSSPSPLPCHKPIGLETTDITSNTASLSWMGYQDAYDIRYRKKPIFFEDFENGLPSDWTTIDNDGDGYNWFHSIYGTYFNAHSGTHLMASESWHDGTVLSPDNWLVTPLLQLQGTMKVWLCANSSSYQDEHFAIYLSTSGNSVSDFTTVLVPETVTSSQYVCYFADLSAYAGQQGYIAIRHFNCSDMDRLRMDDFGLFDDPDDTGEWETVYDVGSSYTLSNLGPNTAYEWQVRGINTSCEGGVTEWSAIDRFITECGTFIVDATHPFTEGFEGKTFAPKCWEAYSTGSFQWLKNTNNNAHSGSASAYSYYYGDNYLVMPDIELSANASAAQLTFWSYNDFVNFFVAGNNTVVLLDGDTETVLWSAETVSQEWEESTIDLSAYLGQTVSLAFKYAGNDGNDWFVDDVMVSVTPATTVTQTIELSSGWNWISTYIDLNEVNGIAMLEEALGDYGITIALQDDYAVYVGDGLWIGLEDYELTNAEMVMVEVTEDCTITLVGSAVDPSTVEITLNPGWTWFGFPVDSELELANVFVDPEPEFGDAIAAYYGGVQFLGEWDGDFDVLLPGQGYVYWNETNEVKVLTFQTGAKTKAVLLRGKHRE